MSEFEMYVYGKTAWAEINAELRVKWIDAGWVTERGGVLEQGFSENSIPTTDAHILELGCDTVIGGYTLPKGSEYMIVWFTNSHKQRRYWFWTLIIGVQQDDGTVKEMKFALNYNPKHIIKIKKLPIDTEKEPVLQ